MRNLFQKRFPLLKQLDSVDCGPTCLRMICAHYGKSYSLEELRTITHFSRTGVSLLGVKLAAEKIGFQTMAGQTVFQKLREIDSPFIAHWNHDHFVVVYKIDGDKVYTADPSGGRVRYTEEEFTKYWAPEDTMEGQPSGVVLLMQPTEAFYEREAQANLREYNRGLRHIYRYLGQHTRLLTQLIVSLLAISLLQL
ncbi:MAG: cysteine peptidase family C39 domain-containing protein, partial [Bacteroidota bacterium]